MEISRKESPDLDRERMRARYRDVRARTLALCQPLEEDDYGIQSMSDVSPPKWHLAHTTWFYEKFILRQQQGDAPFHPAFDYLFNSYYKALGEHQPRTERGQLSRPTLAEIRHYREDVDVRIGGLIADCPENAWDGVRRFLELGLNHEEQHQELLLTDIKHILFTNPLRPAYQKDRRPPNDAPLHQHARWIEYPEGIYKIGHEGPDFSFDNERPRHRIFLEAWRIASRLVTNGGFSEFIADGGYREPRLWLSDGWDAVNAQSWRAPLYWEERDGAWFSMTFSGMLPIDPADPVSHVSYYEADAYARWSGARLPSEAEWEVVATSGSLPQMSGELWQWTSSPYAAYPRFRAETGDVSEYNGKFMCNQMVLRGGSIALPPGHVRPTYRNFFPPAARWQFSGVRLARDS